MNTKDHNPWRTAGFYCPSGTISRVGTPAKHGVKSPPVSTPVGSGLLDEFPPKKPAKAGSHASRYKWVVRGYAKKRGLPHQYTRAELLTIREERSDRDLTHSEVWYIHTSAMLPADLGRFFRLSSSAVRKLQECPRAGAKWTAAEIRKMGEGLNPSGVRY